MSEQELKATCPWCERYMDRHMDAYYYGFDATGEVLIDNILCSVAAAGKGAHHTEHWNEYGYPAKIGLAAKNATAALAALRAELAALKEDHLCLKRSPL